MTRAVLLLALWAAAFSSAAAEPPGLASTAAPPFAPADSATATIRVETVPPGLEIWIDGTLAGRSPVGPLTVPARKVRIRAVSADPRRYASAPDIAELELKPGANQVVHFDLRPPAVIRTRPEPASVLRLRGWAGTLDSLLGETPLTVPASAIESDSLRFRLQGFADTTLEGSRFLAEGSAPVELRRVSFVPERERTKGTPILKRRWFQWALIGAGSILCASAVVLREKGDDTYDQYLDSTNAAEISDLYDQTVHYDRLAAVTLVSGQVLLVGGLVLLVTGL